MRSHRLFSFAGLFFVCGFTAPAVFATPVQYMVTVNTTSVILETGYIDFQLNPTTVAPGSQTASAVITNFATDGVLNPTDPNDGTIGDASGMLPGEVDLINGQTTNEYTEDLEFGTTITFDLALSGAAFSSPNGEGGGSFYLDFFDSNGNPLLTTSSTGYASEIDIKGNGTTSIAYQSPDGRLATPTSVPEPACLGLIGLALMGLGCVYKKLRS